MSLMVEDKGLGVCEVFCGACRAYLTRLETNMPDVLATWTANRHGWTPQTFGHTCAAGGPSIVVGKPPVDVGAWGRLDDRTDPWTRPLTRRDLMPVPPPAPRETRRARAIVLSAPEDSSAESILWWSPTQQARWAAEGRLPAFGKLADGRVVPYSQMFSGPHVHERPSEPDAVCLGPGVFDHVGGA